MIVFEKDGVTETVANSERERYLDNGWKIVKEGVSRPRSKGGYDKSGVWKRDDKAHERDRLHAMSYPEIVEMLLDLKARVEKLEGDKPA